MSKRLQVTRIKEGDGVYYMANGERYENLIELVGSYPDTKFNISD